MQSLARFGRDHVGTTAARNTVSQICVGHIDRSTEPPSNKPDTRGSSRAGRALSVALFAFRRGPPPLTRGLHTVAGLAPGSTAHQTGPPKGARYVSPAR